MTISVRIDHNHHDVIHQILEATIELECVSCETEVKAMENEAALLEKEYDELKKKYYNALLENLKKDVEIEALEESLQSKYRKFSDILPENTLKVLRSLENTKSKDSKFILTALRGLYADRMDELKNINLSGISKKNEDKRPMTPEKQDSLRQMLRERTNDSERVSQINRLIKTAIETINKKN